MEFAFLKPWGKCSLYLHSSMSSMSFGYDFLFASVVPLTLLSTCFATLNRHHTRHPLPRLTALSNKEGMQILSRVHSNKTSNKTVKTKPNQTKPKRNTITSPKILVSSCLFHSSYMGSNIIFIVLSLLLTKASLYLRISLFSFLHYIRWH